MWERSEEERYYEWLDAERKISDMLGISEEEARKLLELIIKIIKLD